MQFQSTSGEFLTLQEITTKNSYLLQQKLENSLTILWFISDNNRLTIDGQSRCFNKYEMIFLTEFHKLEIDEIQKVRLVKFNRPFYCILDHDIEVGCKGVLFFAASALPSIKVPVSDVERFEIFWRMFTLEMESSDDLKKDMLQMMLKRFLIMNTRIFKNQSQYPSEQSESDLVREFNFLVEKHYKTKHTVSDYAELLNKSPKTISNVFSNISSKTPLQFIHQRRCLEAKRLLQYSEKQIQEIAYDIGFEDIQAFSRFFKKIEGVSPSIYRKNMVMGKIANKSGIPA